MLLLYTERFFIPFTIFPIIKDISIFNISIVNYYVEAGN